MPHWQVQNFKSAFPGKNGREFHFHRNGLDVQSLTLGWSQVCFLCSFQWAQDGSLSQRPSKNQSTVVSRTQISFWQAWQDQVDQQRSDTKPSFARLVLKTTEWKNRHTIGSYEWVSIKWSVTWKNLKFNTRKEWSKIQRQNKNLFDMSSTNASFSSNYLTMKFVQYFQKLRSCWKGYGQSWQEGIKHLNSCNRKVFIKLYKTYQLVTRIRIPQHSTSHIHGHNSLHHLGIWEPGGKNRPQFLSSTELYNLLYCLPFFLPLERCNLVYQQLCLILPFHPTRQFFKVYKVS